MEAMIASVPANGPNQMKTPSQKVINMSTTSLAILVSQNGVVRSVEDIPEDAESISLYYENDGSVSASRAYVLGDPLSTNAKFVNRIPTRVSEINYGLISSLKLGDIRLFIEGSYDHAHLRAALDWYRQRLSHYLEITEHSKELEVAMGFHDGVHPLEAEDDDLLDID